MNMSMNPVLPVKEIDDHFDPTKPPSSGEEYIQQVVYERKFCPGIVRVPLSDTKIKPQVPVSIPYTSEKVTCPDVLLPTIQWQKVQVKHFIRLRDKVEKLEARLINNNKPLPTVKRDELRLLKRALFSPEWCHKFILRVKPLMNIVLHIKQNMWTRMFTQQVDLLKEMAEHPEDYPASTIIRLGLWLHAGLLSLQRPLLPSMHDMLRRIAKGCALVRASRGPSSTFEDTIHLTIPICIIARVFNQRDLVDERRQSDFEKRLEKRMTSSDWTKLGISYNETNI